MKFGQWLQNESAQSIQWDYTVTLPALGVNQTLPPQIINNSGSLAEIYACPSDPSKAIKVTSDRQDAKNIVAAQAIKSPNVVKCYAYTNKGVKNGTALLVDFVQGQPAVYSSPEFIGLMEGKYGMEDRIQSRIRILRPDPFRRKILESHGLLNKTEVQKLSELFGALSLLETKLNIFLADFAENVIDAGQNYVVVDFGQ
jgi:hypothetical protein